MKKGDIVQWESCKTIWKGKVLIETKQWVQVASLEDGDLKFWLDKNDLIEEG